MTKGAYQPNDVFFGTPRAIPYILLCQADINFCGRHWIANNWDEYNLMVEQRFTHEKLCGSRPNAAGLLSALTPNDRQALLVATR